MKAILFLCEAGLIITDGDMNVVVSSKFLQAPAAEAFSRIARGEYLPEVELILSKACKKGFDVIHVYHEELKRILEERGFRVEALSEDEWMRFQDRKLRLTVEAGLAESEADAAELVRRFAVEASEEKLRALSSKLDLQLIHAIQTLDEVDKTLNLLSERIVEWYGTHFPELSRLIEDPVAFCRVVAVCGSRSNFSEKTLAEAKFKAEKTRDILSAAETSRGGELRSEDLVEISGLAEKVIGLDSYREGLAKHVVETMETVAPNIAAVAGATVGARLIAKAGGVERLAMLPAGTIQVLGAEKALFRALRRGGKPPKHGIIFQHQAVHSAPKWQRGKVARSLAGKIAIAARIDAYRGVREKSVEERLLKRLEEIKVKYAKPPEVSGVKEERREGRKHGRRKIEKG